MNSTLNLDRIERSLVISAPRDRVWRALSNAEEFGKWFGADLRGQSFAPGKRARGPITLPGFEHATFDVLVERVEPQDLLSYRWHPYCGDSNVDFSKERPTLVVFTLQDVPNAGTLLTVVESGFDALHGQRRVDALGMNSRGWEVQLSNIARYVCA